MTYYRIALQRDQSPTWQWESRVITSLDVVFRVLRLYRTMPWEHIRVFFASSVAGLDEMLACENQGQPSNSLTADQLFDGSKHIDPGEMQQLESAGGPDQSMSAVVTSLLGAQARQEQGQSAPDKRSTSVLERSR
jgi:hypothetical protein